jgi:hypothetical protein
VEVTPNFPEECRFVLERFREVYVNDALAREQNMTAEQRLAFHQTHSGPVMTQLKVWLNAQFDEKKVEPNSGLGVAITYLLKHWDRLTLFLKQPGAPLVGCPSEIISTRRASDGRNGQKTRSLPHIGPKAASDAIRAVADSAFR